jgi:hypothetical protein
MGLDEQFSFMLSKIKEYLARMSNKHDKIRIERYVQKWTTLSFTDLWDGYGV